MSKSNRTTSKLSEVLTLYTTKVEEPSIKFIYEIECTTFKAVKITLDFEGSENFALEGKLGMKLVADIRPFHRTSLGTVYLVSDDQRASLKMGCSWIMTEASEKETTEYLRNHQLQMKPILEDAKQLPFPQSEDDLNDKLVNQVCTNYGKKFVDKDFLPVSSSLFKPDSTPSTKASMIEWKRASDFIVDDYDVFSGGIEPSDIRQGALGNCWFLCAIAALAEFPELVLDIVETKTKNSDGVYRLKFCKNGWWSSVRVDDYFPCYPGSGPIYSRSNGNELWVLLLEKAFAKLHGSYESIKSGWAYEAMMDMTGAPCITIKFEDSLFKTKIANGQLWKDLMNYDRQNYIMSASTPGEDVYTETGKKPGKNGNGLVAGHAYTLISVKQSSKGDKLLKLRNPWGSMEWNGDWSDSSPLWTEDIQNEIEKLVQSDDGTFWMSFDDLLKNFYSVNICLVRHPKYHKVPWKEQRRKFYFDYDNDEEVADELRVSVPIFIMNVSKKGEFIVSIHQEDSRCQGSKSYIDIGVTVLKVDPTYGTFSLMSASGTTVERQNQTEIFELPTGKYLVIPTTTGMKLKQCQENLNIAKSTANTKTLITKNKAGEVVFTDTVINAYTELFTRMDHDSDGHLSKQELDQFMMRTEGAPLEDTAYQWLLHNFESKNAPGLSLRGFLQAQLFVFKHAGADENKLREEFRLLGYNQNMELDSGRFAVLSIHSTVDVSLVTSPFDAKAYEEAIELPVKAKGECTTYEGGKICMYKYRAGYCGISFLVENKHYEPLVFVLDLTGSENVQTNRPSLKHQETIPPGEAKIMHHVVPLDINDGAWSWSYSASYMFDN